jgi:hypothetical protein
MCATQNPELMTPAPSRQSVVTLVRCAVCQYIFRVPAGNGDTEQLAPGGERHAHRLAAVENAVARGALLELDAPDGAFLALARRQGWRVAGIAPTLALKPDHGLPPDALHATLEEGHWLAGSFDAVTCWTPLERSEQPDALVRLAAHYCRIDGVLMLQAHDGPARTEPTFATERRFAPSEIFRLLSRYGFRVERLEREPHAGRLTTRATHAVISRGAHALFQHHRTPVLTRSESAALLVTARYIP